VLKIYQAVIVFMYFVWRKEKTSRWLNVEKGVVWVVTLGKQIADIIHLERKVWSTVNLRVLISECSNHSRIGLMGAYLLCFDRTLLSKARFVLGYHSVPRAYL
jgi:hypothetical protein